jgi:hypothetical protein
MPRPVVPIGEAAVEQFVFRHVPGKHDMGPVAHEQLAGDRHAPRFETVDFLDDGGRVEHHTAGHDAGHAFAEDSAGDQRQLPGLPVGDDRVPRIGAARVADDDFVLLGQDVDELALGLVTPLQTDDACAGHG